MASKKNRRHAKGESSNARTNLDRKRFWSAKAAKNYASLIEKSMHRERGVDLSHPEDEFVENAKDRCWTEFIRPPLDAVTPVVREFYANLIEKHENYRVKVRGRMVPFDCKTINDLYSMPNFDEDDYVQYKRGNVDFGEILTNLCKPRAEWKLNTRQEPVTFKANTLKFHAMSWFLFITSRMMPSNHVSEVTTSRAMLLHCIMNGMTVDAGKVIQSSIINASMQVTTLSMPHSSLITELCNRAGVTWDDTEERLKIRPPIDVHERMIIRRNRQPRQKRDEASGSGQSSSNQPSRSLTLEERVEALEQRVDQQCTRSEEYLAYLSQFTTALAQRFPDPDQHYMPFPPPPT